MSSRADSFADQLTFASQANVDERATFIGRVYLHLGGAILAFAALTAFFLSTPLAERIAVLAFGNGTFGYLLFFGSFIAISWVADSWARTSTSLSTQYMGLGIYVLAESVFFAPLLLFAQQVGPEIIPSAGIVTVMVFAGLSAVVYMTRYNFSFLGPGLAVAGFAILATFIVSAIFGFSLGSLGLWLPVGMIVFASLYILYDTSNILHVYRTDQYVAASLTLFASVMLLFWYVIRLFMALNRED